jgi:hypothetical protein
MPSTRTDRSSASLRSLDVGVALLCWMMAPDVPRWSPGSPTICRNVSPSGSCRYYAVAEHWGDLMEQSRRNGAALSVLDGFFAATALHAGHAKSKDFTSIGVPVFNPWDE